MGEKQDLIKQMLKMQKQFIAREHSSGIEPEAYYSPDEGADLDGYQQTYTDLANRLVELAHEEKGSKR